MHEMNISLVTLWLPPDSYVLWLCRADKDALLLMSLCYLLLIQSQRSWTRIMLRRFRRWSISISTRWSWRTGRSSLKRRTSRMWSSTCLLDTCRSMRGEVRDNYHACGSHGRRPTEDTLSKAPGRTCVTYETLSVFNEHEVWLLNNETNAVVQF